MALVAGLRACCPLEQLQAEQPADPSPAPASAVGTAARLAEARAQGGSAPAMASLQEGGGGGEHHQQQEGSAQQTPGAALLAARSAGGGAAPASGSAMPAPTHATPAESAVAMAAPATVGGTAARRLWRALPTPATQGRRQLAAHLLRVAARLDGSVAEPLLAKAHQVGRGPVSIVHDLLLPLSLLPPVTPPHRARIQLALCPHPQFDVHAQVRQRLHSASSLSGYLCKALTYGCMFLPRHVRLLCAGLQ